MEEWLLGLLRGRISGGRRLGKCVEEDLNNQLERVWGRGSLVWVINRCVGLKDEFSKRKKEEGEGEGGLKMKGSVSFFSHS